MSVTAVPILPIKKGSIPKLWIGVVLAVLVGVALAWLGTNQAVRDGATDAEFLAANVEDSDVTVTESGEQYKVIKPGDGASPKSGDLVRIKYTGMLRDGTEFDTSVGQPEDAVAFPVDGVVPGFSEALKLMQKGGEYRIWIPSDLAYGPVSPGPEVPADSMLIFDVTLLDFRSKEEVEAMQKQLEAMQQGAGGEMPQMPPMPGN